MWDGGRPAAEGKNDWALVRGTGGNMECPQKPIPKAAVSAIGVETLHEHVVFQTLDVRDNQGWNTMHLDLSQEAASRFLRDDISSNKLFEEGLGTIHGVDRDALSAVIGTSDAGVHDAPVGWARRIVHDLAELEDKIFLVHEASLRLSGLLYYYMIL